ncbi:MAG: F0F1 ATP synthase subunit A [Clostridia bacterium]|nr:F0F1 ATP synthase subunit A [Clostridia bacterium]
MTETKKTGKPSRVIDVLLILMMVLPLLAAVVLKVLYTPESKGVDIHGALVYYAAEGADISQVISGDLIITEAQINSWLVMISITGFCLFLTHGLEEHAHSARQHLAEWLVEKAESLVSGNMGDFHLYITPFIMAMMCLSVFSSLMSLLGVFAPTSDLSVVFGWAVLVFFLILIAKICCGPKVFVKSMTADGPVVAALNFIGDFSTPVSMAFRHYGNVMSGAVIGVLVASFLQWLSRTVFGGIGAAFPLLQIGLPGILSIYFDVFSGGLQAFIFAMLTMLNLGGAFPLEDWLKRHDRRRKEKQAAQQTV